jgi:hypothetical protein
MNQKKTIDRNTPSLEIQDAWAESYDLSKGLGELIHLAAGSRDGLSQSAAFALGALADQLSDKMTVIDGFFRTPKDGEL